MTTHKGYYADARAYATELARFAEEHAAEVGNDPERLAGLVWEHSRELGDTYGRLAREHRHVIVSRAVSLATDTPRLTRDDILARMAAIDEERES